MGNSTGVPQKLKRKLSYEPAIPLLGVHAKVLKEVSQRDICTLKVKHIDNNQNMETTKGSIKKVWI
jgi:hypothetical protein